MSLLAFLSSNELLIVLIIGVVLFGGSQLPKLARNLGRAQKELQKGLAEGAKEVADSSETEAGSGDG
ncbi:MAG: twin-arginine translocase TatA/TatE family subunit [Actinobacteria bacterium]|jgi:sec-independent protein translocase protein TatA|nr:MAG: twin-arginine translocase TatA/TatE family subunit [Actinomycetota bacterium]